VKGGKITRERREGQHVQSIVHRGPEAMAGKKAKKVRKKAGK
jgi:hypothetical protein